MYLVSSIQRALIAFKWKEYRYEISMEINNWFSEIKISSISFETKIYTGERLELTTRLVLIE